MALRPCDAIFGVCLPYRKGVRPAVEAYFCGFGVLIFPTWGDRFSARVEPGSIFEAVA